jgi:hypothetical protein
MGLFGAVISAMFVALAALAPTGAQAAPNSLKVNSSDAVVTSSCEFTVIRFNENNTGPNTVTARLTIKGAEIKPSFFSPRKVATLQVSCNVFGLTTSEFQSLSKINNGSTVYRSKYVEMVVDPQGYRACVGATYILRDGTLGGTSGSCNPPF